MIQLRPQVCANHNEHQPGRVEHRFRGKLGHLWELRHAASVPLPNILGRDPPKFSLQVPLAPGVVGANNHSMDTHDTPAAANSNASGQMSDPRPETDLGVGATMEAKPLPRRPKLDKLPPYRVLLHDDDINTDVFVMQSLLELTPLTQHAAFDITELAQKHGVAQVLVTHKERAELYMEQFGSKKITVTIEPAE